MENKTTHPIVLIAAALVIFSAGVFVGNLTAGSTPTMEEMSETVQDAVTGNVDTESGSEASDVSNGSDIAFTMSVESLSDGQKVMLRGMGIDSNEIEVTNDMVACIEAKVESSRLNEIRNGASPTISEGITLMGCYSAS